VVKIRLARCGKKHMPFYRIVAADVRSPRDGKFIEMLGFYNPLAKSDEKQYKINLEKAKKLLLLGCKMTTTVAALYKKAIRDAANSE
jgi:small subunit ribosomal protein S16